MQTDTDTPRIIVLPAELADQIAAGEVVERPASVVKELVENSLDAGARRIDIEIEGGGLDLIRVTDNGTGMTPKEAHLSLLRHATSKLQKVEDLFGLHTMGFRGEALPSIAAVSRLTLTTRTAAALAAYRLVIQGGREPAPGQQVGAPIGTQIEVRELLKNVPARLKFMKTAVTEASHIQETLVRLALAYPEVHLRLRSGDKITLDLPPHRSGLDRAQAALGSRSGPAQLYLASGGEGSVEVEAYLAAPACSTSTPRNVYLLVNRRFIRDRSLLHAAVMGYGELLERGRYPLSVIKVDIAGEGVDVNVHPQKLEVRFAKAQEVYTAVRHVMQATSSRAPWLTGGPAADGYAGDLFAADDRPSYGSPDDEQDDGPETRNHATDPLESATGPRNPATDPANPFSSPRFPGSGAEHQQGPNGGRPPQHGLTASGAGLAEHRARLQQAMDLFAPSPRVPVPDSGEQAGPGASAVHRFFSTMAYLGQLRRTYLLCEHQGELVLIDQHAAHERLAFERLRTAHAAREVRAQRLLFPLSLDLDPGRSAALEEHGALLGSLGFEIRPFSGNSFALLAVPDAAIFGRGARVHQDPEKLLLKVVDDLLEDGSTAALSARVEGVLATIACHSVVRAGDQLDPTRAQALLTSMDEVPYVPHCPHGRPVLVRMPPTEIERRFGRT